MADRSRARTSGAGSGLNLSALAEVTGAVQAGAGLPEVLRAAGRVLGASLVLIDRSASILAVAARSPADERSLLREAEDVATIELKVADTSVGELRMRLRSGDPDPALLSLVTTLIASEVERVRAPERASEEAARGFLDAIIDRRLREREQILGAARELGCDLASGATMLVVRVRARVPTDDDWRRRLLTVASRGARSIVPGALAAPSDTDSATVNVLIPDPDGEAGRRASAAILRELESGLAGFIFAIGRSRWVNDAAELGRGGNEAMLAANVIEGDPEVTELAFDQTGTYQLLLPYMSEPTELRRFYRETVRPLVSYDEQYETDLLGTLATFLDCDANVNATAARLITHRHTIRYRFERVRELTGLDVQSTDGREKLSLGLKAMRVLGIAAPRGPATEPGAEGGRVPR
jgi:sugar diacid utilization regulator